MQIQINQDKKELKSHGCYEFPVLVSHENLFSYERGSFFWHWHPEIELTLVLEGDIIYQVESQTFHLKAGEGLFCNANMLHTGHLFNQKDCVYISTTFDPRIIYGFETSMVQTKFVTPLTLNSTLSSIHLKPEIFWQKEMLDGCRKIWSLTGTKPDTYELDILAVLMHIWSLLYNHARPDTKNQPSVRRDRDRLHQILAYIHDHYSEKLTLDDIAGHINICKSECCRFFKKHMNISIFDYLMHYRIEKSLPLLQNTSESITDIASMTGFSNSCYFSKIFKEDIGCTPREYRAKTRTL